ncbi:hypothetical protein ACLK2H_01190 [Escherichia coli]
MPIPVVIDRTVAAMSDFAAGANIDGKHYFGINWHATWQPQKLLISVMSLPAIEARTVRVPC